MMFASFHSKGTTPFSNNNILASGILMCSSVSISSFGGIPTSSDYLLSFITFVFLATISGVTISCPKYSYLASWKLTSGTGNELISFNNNNLLTNVSF